MWIQCQFCRIRYRLFFGIQEIALEFFQEYLEQTGQAGNSISVTAYRNLHSNTRAYEALWTGEYTFIFPMKKK